MNHAGASLPSHPQDADALGERMRIRASRTVAPVSEDALRRAWLLRDQMHHLGCEANVLASLEQAPRKTLGALLAQDGFTVLLKLLVAHEVAFVVTGGLACALNGFIRVTEDADIVVQVTEANITRLASALGLWGDGHGRQLTVADFAPGPGPVRVLEFYALDIYCEVNGCDYEQLRHRALQNHHGFYFLHPEDLIACKEPSLRPKDRMDVQALRRILVEKQVRRENRNEP